MLITASPLPLRVATTPSAKWATKVGELRKTCQDAASLSTKIRYVGVINEFGRTLTGALRPGTVPILDKRHTQNEFFIVSSLLNMRSGSVRPLGRLDHMTLQHDKVYIVVIPEGRNIYYVSIDVDVKNISGLILKIKKKISK